MTTMQVLDRLVAVNLDVRIWSGRKKLTAEDLSLGAAVPPEDLVSLGSKRVCDPDPIKVFHRLKKQAERVCLTGGMRFLGGYAIPEERTETVAAELDTLGEAFARERAGFVAGYGQAIEDWITRHPQWEAAIRKAVDPASVVESRLGFGYQLYRIAPTVHAGNLAEQVEGLGDTLFGEVAGIARALEESFLGKDALSQRALATFRRIREKLGCLTFVDYRVQPVLESLENWLLRTPASGPITGALFNEGFGLMQLVSDPRKMSDHGAGILALQDLIPIPEDPLPEDAAQDDEGCEWAFGGPLGDEAPDEATDTVPSPWEPSPGPPLERLGRHGPCPVHGGRDGFRLFRDVVETGGGICNSCGTFPDGFALLMWVNRWSFPQALRAVAQALCVSADGMPQRSLSCRPSAWAIERDGKALIEALARVWAQSLDPADRRAGPLWAYLRRRGLAPTQLDAGVVRFHPFLGYWQRTDDGKWALLGRYPAMVSRVTGADGSPVTLHRTYLTPDGRKAPVAEPKKLMAYPGDRLVGGAIRLFAPAPVLGIAEGIETALAVHCQTRMPVWSAVSAGLLTRFEPPAKTSLVVIWADRDRSGAGEVAARSLRERLLGRGIAVAVRLPPGPIPAGAKGIDWADVWADRLQRAAA